MSFALSLIAGALTLPAVIAVLIAPGTFSVRFRESITVMLEAKPTGGFDHEE